MSEKVLKEIQEDLGEECDFVQVGSTTQYFDAIPLLVNRWRFDTRRGPIYIWVHGEDWGYC